MYFMSFIQFLLLPFCVAKTTVPVFLLDFDYVLSNLFLENNPFAKIPTPQFTDVVQEAIRQFSVIVLFVEETFSSEDVSLKDDRGTPFANLRDEMVKRKVKYIPSVDSPMKVLSRLLQPVDKNVFILKPGQLFHSTENLKYFYVFFNDRGNETRAEALRRHDMVIQHVYETTRKTADGPVLAIYTGKVNPVTVATYERGATVGEDPYSPLEKGLVLASRSVLYRFVGLTIDSGDRTRRSFFNDDDDPPSKPPEEKTTDDSLSSTVKVGEYQLEFFFFFQSTRWRLDRIKLYEANEWVGDHNLSTYIGAPYGRSLVCDEPLVFYNTRDKSAMVIPEYQIQPFREEVQAPDKAVTAVTNNDDEPIGTEATPAVTEGGDKSALPTEFGPPVKCTPYFTIGILTGLVVSFLCLTILLTGVFCLYHCETNDRFDDPQAKQIVVPAGE